MLKPRVLDFWYAYKNLVYMLAFQISQNLAGLNQQYKARYIITINLIGSIFISEKIIFFKAIELCNLKMQHEFALVTEMMNKRPILK